MERETICDICHKNVDDPVELGEIYKKPKLQVHYYCLLLSTHLPQKGEEKSGILGFLLHDIRAEVERCKKRICHYCKENHASVKCHHCDIIFHPICGLTNNCLFEFVDEFRSFCDSHNGISHAYPHNENEGCYICLQPMGQYNPLTSISSRCCNLDCWVHRRCIKQYALAAGYYLHCLWCKSENFRDDIRRLGVFVPDRDALWEREKGAFGELYQRYSKCDADVCLCPHGRSFKSKSRWYILVCSTCATAGIHVGCLSEKDDEDNYKCLCCIQILKGNTELFENSIIKAKIDHSQKSRTGSPDRTLYMSKSQATSNNFGLHATMPDLTKSLKRVHNEELQQILPLSKMQISRNHKNSDNDLSLSGLSPLKDSSNLSFPGSDKRKNVIYVDLENNKKCKFDNDLIHELVKQSKNERILNEAIIVLSEDDDSDKSAGQLLQKLTKSTPGNFPKPRPLRTTKTDTREQCFERVSNSIMMYDAESFCDSSLYRVSIEDEIIETEDNNLQLNGIECENADILAEKLSRYFKGYRPGTPESDSD